MNTRSARNWSAESYRGRVVRARETDACPGALQVHQAADGALVRVRLPGGMITATQLTALSDVSSGLCSQFGRTIFLRSASKYFTSGPRESTCKNGRG